MIQNLNKIHNLSKHKKGFAFSVLSLFLVFLIFGFGSLYLFKADFTQDAQFRESRILFVDGEIDYFKQSYMQNSLQFSGYNTLNELAIYLKANNKVNLVKDNPEKLNQLILEGMKYGTFETNNIPNLNTKNIGFIKQSFVNDFKDNYQGNFSFELLNVSLFETRSYYVDFQFLANYTVTTKDNLSDWNFVDEFMVQVPISELYDPEFLFRGNKLVPIRSSEFYLPTLNWSLKNFNDTVANMYSTVFYKPKFDYTLGQSYLKRFLGATKGSFFGVKNSFNFDDDIFYDGIYDTGIQNLNGKLFANTIMLFDFNSDSLNGTTMLEKTDYESNFTVSPLSADCSNYGVISQQFCQFKTGINLQNSKKPIYFSNTFSISSWVNYNLTPNRDITIIGGPITLGIDRLNAQTFFEFNSNSGVQKIYSNKTISENTWTHILITYSGSKLNFYINGQLDSQISVPNSTKTQLTNLHIGPASNLATSMKLDELALYSKVLSESEISTLYKDEKAIKIDYVDSLFGKGIRFDGIDDYIQISRNKSLTNTHSTGIWFKMEKYPNLADDEALLTNDPYIAIKSDTRKLRYFNYGVNDKQLPADNYYEGNQELKLNKWYYVVTTYNGALGEYSIYLNGELDAKVTNKFPTGSSLNLGYIGGENTYRFFEGIIDEVRLYDRVLTPNEIKLNYRNYQSYSKGCCNYIILVNQNALGYTTTANYDKVSSSSTLFYNNYNDADWNNITIYQTSNLTSTVGSDEYYNLLMDICLFETYNFLDYDPFAKSIPTNSWNPGEIGTEHCKNLVKAGIY